VGGFSSCYSRSYICCCAVIHWIAGSSNERRNAEVELVVLRHQLMVLKRQMGRPRLRRHDRLFMVAIGRALPRARWSSFLVSPQTLLRWHRELVRRKWTFRAKVRRRQATDHRRGPGAHPADGKGETQGGDACGPGVSSPSSGSESRDHDPQAASGERLRPGSPERWPHLERVPPVTSPRHPCARDFFTVETLMIRTVYVLFAIEIWSRRVQILGVTRNPNSAWVTQQAGTLRWGKDLEGSGSRLGTEMPSTPVPSTRCSSPKGWASSSRRSGLRERTRSPSGGSARSGPSG
jgi:hypothetical protein